jgi:hypothetical protein
VHPAPSNTNSKHPPPQKKQTTRASPPTGPPLPLEDANRYALLLDIDGNAWSDRFRLFAHFNTPVLKQASNLTAFFEHLMPPGGAAVEHYAHDLSDLLARAQELLQELQREPDRLLRMAGGRVGCVGGRCKWGAACEWGAAAGVSDVRLHAATSC